MSDPPPAGSRVRIVVRELGEFYGDVVPATLKSGRWPIAPWGISRTFCIAPDDIMEIEVIDPSGAFVQRVTLRQRNELGDRSPQSPWRGAPEGSKGRKGGKAPSKKGLGQR